LLQSCSQGESFRFGVIYDAPNQRWRVNCIDVEQPTMERFHGGHRRFYLELWRED
jgi:hypothetical protein